MSRILVDSSFLIALFRRDDLNHALAIENKDLLNNPCFITNLVISEVLTVLAMKTKDMDLVNLAFNFMNDNFTIIKEFQTHNFNYNVFSLFSQFNDENYNLSFVDSSLVYLSDIHGFKLLTLDNGFKGISNVDLVL
ncbi:MAG: PIN domain-containing protein [Methanobrevibacter olleyae]|uniref:PIN domain-containing protein n=1 Tax=Methanobrevibacter olleyae TaxID=294671 RepID=A0A8T3VNW5_METOL|nr:PIN domain-containing protein [Methanobrevibacter olleyae]